MTTYKFTDGSKSAVHRIDDDGISRSSCTIENPRFLEWLASGNTPEPADPPTVGQIIADITTATQARLDSFARTRNYDGILSACTYATSAHPQFAAEGQYCVTARDATWSALYVVMAEVEAGTRPMPTGYQDIEPDLPALVWPA